MKQFVMLGARPGGSEMKMSVVAAWMVAVPVALLLAWWLRCAPSPTLESERAAVSPAADRIPSGDVDACVAALQRAPVVDLAAGVGFAGDGTTAASTEVVTTFRSHGKLDPLTKASVRALQLDSIRRAEEELVRVRGKGDLAAEAVSTERLAQKQVMLRMLEEDAYLTLDVGAVWKMWPSGLEGWFIVQSRTVRLPSGVDADLVFCIKKGAHEDLDAATETKRELVLFLAEDAAYRINGLPDDERIATIAAFERLRAGSAVTEQDHPRLAMFLPLQVLERESFGASFRIDAARALVTVVPPR